MKTYTIIWLLLTDKSFRHQLKDVLVYALTAYEKLRGYRSSDVCHFDHYYKESIFDSHNVEWLTYERDNFDISYLKKCHRKRK